MKQNGLFLFFAFSLSGLVACSNSSSQLEGTWTSGCVGTYAGTPGSAPTDTPFVYTLNFNGSQATSSIDSYDGSGCSGQAGTHTEFHASFVVSGTSSVANGANNIDFTASSSLMLQNTAQRAQNASSLGVCGISNFTMGQAVNIAGLDCSGVNIPNTDNASPGVTTYNIFLVTNNQLCLGQTQAGTSPAYRPTSLAPSNNCFTKQ